MPRGKRGHKSDRHSYIKLIVTSDCVAVSILNEYIEFLELVYNTRVLVTQKNDRASWVCFFQNDHTTAGIKVAGWLYGIEYEIVKP